MELKKIIIHELIKEQKLTLANEYLSSSVYDINGDTIDLADRLNRSFIRDSITYAIFKIEEGDKFPNYFSHYQLSGQQNLDFVTFTRSAIMNLKQIISPIIFASGGYFVFAEYQEGNINYVSVFLIRDEKGLVFRKKQDGKGFEINSVSHLNTSKLAMGCRINIDRYKNNDGKYLALIKNKSRELSDYFNRWISTDQPESSSEYTDTLYQIVSNITPPINPETGNNYEIDEFRKKVHDYVNNHPSKMVNVSELSYYFYHDNDTIPFYAQENNFPIDSEFKADGRKLRKFWRLEVNGDGIQLKFSRGDLNTKVRFSEENPDMILIESKKFATKFKKESEDEI